MSTINTLSSQILRVVNGGNTSVDSKVQRRDVWKRVRQVLAEILQIKILEKKGGYSDRTALTTYIATYVGVAVTETNNRATSLLPEFPVSLPYNKAIKAIFPDDGKGTDARMEERMIRRNQPYVTLGFRSSKNMEGRHTYYVEGQFIVYDKVVTIKSIKDDGVILKLVIPAPDTVKVDDVLPIYPEQEALLMRTVVQDLMPQKAVQEDKLSDANADLNPTENAA